MSYYRAQLADFYIGRVYEQRAGDLHNWRVASISESHYHAQPGGHYHLMEIIVNLQLFKNRAPYYKIKHLDSDDILTFGFVEKVDKNFEDPNTYVAFEYGKFTLLLYSKSLRIDIFEEVQGEEERLFTGQLLDFNELKLILKQTGVLLDLDRKQKVKERV